MHLADRFFCYPDRKNRGTPADDGLAYEDVSFVAADGVRLHAWFLPATGGRAAAVGTVLHLHGNAANITGHYRFIHWLPNAGFNVLTLDYRGYGRSQGRPSRQGFLLDAQAALDRLRIRPDVDPDRIVVFGQSIGGVIASVLATRNQQHIRAAAIDSAFTSYRAIARYHVLHNPILLPLAWWFPLLVDRGDDAIDAVPAISPMPVFFIHGTADRIVPSWMSQELYDAAREPKSIWLIDGLDHTEVWEAAPDAARGRLSSFFQSACETAPRAIRSITSGNSSRSTA